MAIRIIIMAGGTGGHVFPALAVAEQMIADGHKVSWLGTRKGIEASVVPAANISIDWLSVSGLRGKGALSAILAPFMLVIACWQAMMVILQRKPDVVLGLGGFASGPGGLMAWLLRKPLVIHEQNRVPGTTNRLLSKFSSKVLEAFPGSFAAHLQAISTGNPVRKEMLGVVNKEKHEGIRLLVLGGSLGASILNEMVPKALKNIQQELAIDIKHQSGKATLELAQAGYKNAGVKAEISIFIEDMKQAYTWADIVICRAGAMTVSELAVMGLPAILVPLPTAIDDHQTKNAEYLADAGGAILLPQATLTAEVLERAIRGIAKEKSKREEMSIKTKRLAMPDATSLVVQQCLGVAL
jgi:UDP-N-acetylglucosamine--N-acetylmuramyl-(pentapeptide) pyrophosphoryl-undecaprenol N-acetylglucosamine transferase